MVAMACALCPSGLSLLSLNEEEGYLAYALIWSHTNFVLRCTTYGLVQRPGQMALFGPKTLSNDHPLVKQ